jgi:hypothetical protein
MCSMDRTDRTSARALRHAISVMVVAAGTACLPSVAGQASTSFDVSITVRSAPTTCTASLHGTAAQVLCAPMVVSSAIAAPVTAAGGQVGPIGVRLPDTRMRVAGALVEVGEESFRAWGAYSSRIVAAGGVEYLEMTVTW